MKVKGTQIAILFLLSIFTACETHNEDYVARIDGKYDVSKQELIQQYKEYYFGVRFQDAEYKGYGKALDRLLTNKLKQIDFINQGLHKDQELIEGIQRVISEELLVLYFESEYLGQYITDEVINDYYQSLGRKVTYQQIILNKSNADDIEQLKDKAIAIKEEAEKNNNFNSLVREYSEDPKSVETNGKMPVMTWREGTESPQNQVIFRMSEGGISVLEVSKNILIVKVNQVEEVEIPPLERIKPTIYKLLEEVYAPRAYADFDRDKANLLDRKQYEWNQEGLNQLAEWSKINRFYSDGKYKSYMKDYLTAGNNFEILTYENGTVDLEKYLYLLNNILLINISTAVDPHDFKDFIDEALRTELIVEKAKELGLDDNILSMDTNSEVILEEFVRLYNERYITSEIPEQNSANYEAFYEETKDSLFYQPDKVNLYAKIYDTEEEAQAAMDKINNGTKFEDLFHGWKVKTYYINEEGDIDSYLSNEPNYFGDEAFKLAEGETAGPIEFQENNETKYAVIKAHNVLEEKILSLNEVQPTRLERLFRGYYWNKYNEEIARDLRQKYAIEINEQALIDLSSSNK